MQNLQGLQCDYRRFVDPSDINPEPYRALQCSGGYAGEGSVLFLNIAVKLSSPEPVLV